MIWAMAIGGVTLKVLHGPRYPIVSAFLYAGTGCHFFAVLWYAQ